jgi:hypothetical protein
VTSPFCIQAARVFGNLLQAISRMTSHEAVREDREDREDREEEAKECLSSVRWAF